MSDIKMFLYLFRKDRGIKCEDMARKMNITRGYLSSVENSKRPLTDSFYQKLMYAYSLTDIEHEYFSEIAKSEGIKSVFRIHDGYLESADIASDTLYIPRSVRIVGARAFENQTEIKSVHFHEGVEEVGMDAFSGCVNISKVFASSVSDFSKIVFSSHNSNPIAFSGNLYINGEPLTELCISDDTTEILRSSFDGLLSLKRIVLGKNVKSIAPYAFRGCKNLLEIDFGDAPLESIGEYAFWECSSLFSVNIPLSTRDIKSFAFGRCASLREFQISKNIKSISPYTFSECHLLESVVIENGVQAIHTFAFEECSELERVVVPKSVKYIDAYAFANCGNLSEIEYKGSMNAWKRATKSTTLTSENDYFSFYDIVCSDGIIKKTR